MDARQFAFCALALMLFSAGCAQQATAKNSTAIALGDTALVDYALSVADANGTNFVPYDTSMRDIAVRYGIYDSNRTYAPISVHVGADSGFIPSFAYSLIGMAAGENKSFVIEPADGYGEYDSGRVISLNRTYGASRYEEIPISYFADNNLSSAPGTGIPGAYWNATVVNATNTSATIRVDPEINKTLTFSGLPERVVSFGNDSMVLEIMAEEGAVYDIQDASGTVQSAMASVVNATSVVLDANNPLAGKRLHFTVYVRQITQANRTNSTT